MKARKLIRLLLATRNLQTALYAWRIGVPWMHLERRGKRVVMKGTTILCEQLPCPLPNAFYDRIRLLSGLGFKFEAVSGKGKNVILVDTGEVKLCLDGEDALSVLEEVFGNLEYGAFLSEPTIVIDIGMNVATTALYFAKEQAVKRVIGFEPCSETIQRAERNLALNPEIARKIEVRSFALAKSDGTCYLQVEPGLSNEARIARESDQVKTGSAGIPIEMRDAEPELQSIFANTDESESIILKVDCEGSEREIFERLSSDTLSRIRVILLEWHHEDILEEIRMKLQRFDFQLLIRRNGEKHTGMLYAFRASVPAEPQH